MKIAISIWNDCVSNVFDFADCILLVEVENSKEISRAQIQFECKFFSQRINQLKSLKVDLIICGAISRAFAELVIASGIEVLAYVTGDINDVLDAYINGDLAQSQFAMPGCWPGARKGLGRCGQGKRHCRHQGNNSNNEL